MFDVERLGTLSILAMPPRLAVTHVRGFIEGVQEELRNGARRVALDLRETETIDMTALAAIVEMYKQSANRGVELRLSAPRESVRRLFSITRLDRVLPIDELMESEDELAAAAE